MLTEPVRYDGPKFAATNGVTLCYDTFGSPEDAPLVLIMGLATQMIVWDEDFCRLLAACGRYVIRFDNRDIGCSTKLWEPKPPNIADILITGFAGSKLRVRYTLLDMAKDTLGLLDALGIASAHVVGISMGGAIGQEIAIAFPARLRTLTSIMSSTGDPKLPPPTLAALAVLFARPAPNRESYLRQYVKTWKTLTGKQFPFDPERTRSQGERAYERGINPAGAARQMLAIIASGNRREALRRITAPTLVIHGTNDPLVRYAAAPDLAAAIPGAKLLTIEGMGHTLPRGAWPRIVDAIAAHTTEPPLSSCRTGAGTGC
jgi:pimeloyl-ACP methyl ester carboxylesterase